ncbi:DUF4386 domain-containing protein [Rhodosalinus halophilus]|uniref:DUF4386 domain-containing protein n=1 Tax=Rhodosalinus halophilus TaxID=2259333 RepID=A0A365UBC1_9RHOB|nr:DUF4386 domain-containing protein [Rhodosalinus halophilus]RBI86599.1 DUF4386 domain-containing protein [Rhodosalinus halophilus]
MTASQDAAAGAQARLAGVLYLIIIAAGIWSEVAVRAALMVPGDATATGANILAAEGAVRLSLAADTVMGLADAGLAVLLFLLLRPVSLPLALAAMVFRLIQNALIGANLLNQQAALTAAASDPARAAEALALHAFGYDLALIFFGVSCLMMAALILRSGWIPRLIGYGIGAAGLVYLTGSYLRILAPGLSDSFAPAYAICLLAELSFALWLLLLAPRALRRP